MDPEFEHLEGDYEIDKSGYELLPVTYVGTQCSKCGGQVHDPCDKCGAIVHVGEWPFCPHGIVGRTHHEFEAYYDMGLDATITTRDQRRQLLKEAKADAKDGMRKGDLSARLDRVKADRKSKGLDRRPTNPVYFY